MEPFHGENGKLMLDIAEQVMMPSPKTIHSW